ncbi:MAG TPA: hypothetical protein VD768_08755 [Sphingomicrobium sp.]|nr:hypothetical protein [Sphingomicrobium sp.]
MPTSTLTRPPLCETDPSRRDGAIDLNAVAHAEYRERRRRFTVEYQQDFRPDSGLDWTVRLYGEGHWCRADGHPHKFRTREAAEQAGQRWVATGRAE